MPLLTLYSIDAHPLLGARYVGLKTDDERLGQHLMAELLLGLDAPAYDGEDADALAVAIVRQINFQLEAGITPQVLKSDANKQPGNTTSYRDRYVEPGAWAIVARVTNVATVGFSAPAPGV